MKQEFVLKACFKQSERSKEITCAQNKVKQSCFRAKVLSERRIKPSDKTKEFVKFLLGLKSFFIILRSEFFEYDAFWFPQLDRTEYHFHLLAFTKRFPIFTLASHITPRLRTSDAKTEKLNTLITQKSSKSFLILRRK